MSEKETIPDGFESVGVIMSNFNEEIEDNAEGQLKAGGVYGEYPGWSFYAFVWWDSKFKAMIKQYKVHVNTISADSLQEIMDIARQYYGSG